MKTKSKLGLIFGTNSKVKIRKLRKWKTKPKTKIGTIFLKKQFEKTLKSRVNKRLVIVSRLGSLELGLAFKTRTQTKTNFFFLEKSSQN
jgi:hypothetical protein